MEFGWIRLNFGKLNVPFHRYVFNSQRVTVRFGKAFGRAVLIEVGNLLESSLSVCLNVGK
jgi:hypothetical protein